MDVSRIWVHIFLSHKVKLFISRRKIILAAFFDTKKQFILDAVRESMITRFFDGKSELVLKTGYKKESE